MVEIIEEGIKKEIIPYPYSCIVHSPELAYFEAYKNIGRKYTILKRSDLAQVVLQEALTKCPHGGSIFIKRHEGTLANCYDLGSTGLVVADDRSIQILGEAAIPGAKIMSEPGVLFQYSGTDYALKVGSATADGDKANVILKNFTIVVKNDGGSGLLVAQTEQAHLFNIRVKAYLASPVNGIHLINTTAANHLIELCLVAGSPTRRWTRGYYIQGANFHWIGCMCHNADYGFYEATGYGGPGYSTYRRCSTSDIQIDSFTIRAANVLMLNPYIEFGNVANERGIVVDTSGACIQIYDPYGGVPIGAGGKFWDFGANKNVFIKSNQDGHNTEYQVQTDAEWVNPSYDTPSSFFEGQKTLVYNSTRGEYRLYTYLNGAWHYVALT